MEGNGYIMSRENRIWQRQKGSEDFYQTTNYLLVEALSFLFLYVLMPFDKFDILTWKVIEW
jgi:hypothetical protein